MIPELTDPRFGVSAIGPLLTQSLAVPPWIDIGDTPEGEPALWWRPGPTKTRYPEWKLGGSSSAAFWRLLDLADQNDSANFLVYARTFGPLGLWPLRTSDGHPVSGFEEHWVPSAPEGIRTPLRFEAERDLIRLRSAIDSGHLDVMYEPLSEWRHWASCLRATARLFVDLVRDKVGRRRDWAMIGFEFGYQGLRWMEYYDDFARNITKQRAELARYVDSKFLRWSGLTPRMEWVSARPQYLLDYHGEDSRAFNAKGMRARWPPNSLFPALVAQLLSLTSVGSKLYVCEEPDCGQLYERVIAPRPGAPVRCRKCAATAHRADKAKWARNHRALVKTA